MSSETNPPESRARALQFDNSSDCRQRRLVGIARRFGHGSRLPPGSVSWAANNTGVYRGRITKVRFVAGTAGSSKPWGNVFKGLGTEPGRKHPGYARTCHNIVVHKYVHVQCFRERPVARTTVARSSCRRRHAGQSRTDPARARPSTYYVRTHAHMSVSCVRIHLCTDG